jgi:hypothetical protein
MKTKQEIEQLAEKECTHHFDLRIGYYKGYIQCQEDMADEIQSLKEQLMLKTAAYSELGNHYSHLLLKLNKQD